MNFLRGIVRAQGQIFLQAGWGPAVFALAAMTVASAWFALAALAGAAVQAGCALALAGWDDARGLHRLREGGTRARSGIPGHDPESSRVGAKAMARSRAGVIPAEVDQGLHGFNGALTGCAAVLACGPGIPAALWTLAGSAVCALIVWGAPKLSWPESLPLLTGPFCLVNSIAVAIAVPFERTQGAVVPLGSPVHDVLAGAVRGAHQVILGGSVLGGLLVLAGMFAAGWRAGVWAAAGTLVGTLAGFVGIGQGPAASGLLGYGALLVTVALGVAFPARGSRILRIGVPVLAAAFTVPLWWVITAVGVAPYTWPFVLVTWTVLALRSRQWRAGEARHDER
ncbi:urea transporter [Kocuria sp. CPCC 205261]|uniref:urea transporter n=1 Tax=Kocuria sp. CPCC 205261 TaxID=3073554 RepID=UPI0034D4E49F